MRNMKKIFPQKFKRWSTLADLSQPRPRPHEETVSLESLSLGHLFTGDIIDSG